jgi:hypothetical protein
LIDREHPDLLPLLGPELRDDEEADPAEMAQRMVDLYSAVRVKQQEQQAAAETNNAAASLDVEAPQRQETRTDAAEASLGPQGKTSIIESFGARLYVVGNSRKILVSETEDNVLQAFAEQELMDTGQLREKSGQDDAVALLRGLKRRYSKAFDTAIRMPGGKGKGGYFAKVIHKSNDNL